MKTEIEHIENGEVVFKIIDDEGGESNFIITFNKNSFEAGIIVNKYNTLPNGDRVYIPVTVNPLNLYSIKLN